jgi:NlpC/P60 family putative phage cell wall peptidase
MAAPLPLGEVGSATREGGGAGEGLRPHPPISPTDPERVVAEARSWIGTPYRHQASLKGVGCDCLGLLRGVWRALLGDEPETAPPYAADWAEAGGAEALRDAARRHLVEVEPHVFAAGDILLFRWRDHLPAKHCAIVSGADLMIHAHEGACVAEVAIAPWWRRHLAYAFRFPLGRSNS